MLKVNVDSSGITRLQAEIAGQGKQVRFALERSLNAAAFHAKKTTEREIGRVFDRPTPWVSRSVRYTKANRKSQQVMESTVDFDFWGNKQGVTASQVLDAQIRGGQRRQKRHEVALRRVGILQDGWAVVPGSAAKMDAYGNMSAGQINQIIAWFRGFGEQGYQANINERGRKRIGRDKRSGARGFAYFAILKPRGKLIPGIYQRFETAFGSAVKPVMIFVPLPKYRRRLDFYGLAERSAREEFNRVFPGNLEDAIRTAR